jgi:6-phosphogluconolactonase/glucosamine-6-phosphate isomerase/deaminase
MDIVIMADKRELGKAAAAAGAERLRAALRERGSANIIVATGASQFEMLEQLVREPDIAWPSVTAFHLDEYVGLPITHPASFRRYLWERFVSRLPLPLATFHYLDGERDARGPNAAEWASSSAATRSTWRSSASARTDIWRSTTRRPTSKLPSRTL